MHNMFDKQDGHTLDGFSALYISSGQQRQLWLGALTMLSEYLLDA